MKFFNKKHVFPDEFTLDNATLRIGKLEFKHMFSDVERRMSYRVIDHSSSVQIIADISNDLNYGDPISSLFFRINANDTQCIKDGILSVISFTGININLSKKITFRICDKGIDFLLQKSLCNNDRSFELCC